MVMEGTVVMGTVVIVICSGDVGAMVNVHVGTCTVGVVHHYMTRMSMDMVLNAARKP